MDNRFEKYADLLLKKCINIKKGQPLLLSCPIECYELVRIITRKATEMGVDDIHFEWDDSYLKSYELMNYSDEAIEKSTFWNKSIYDEYAKKNGAFLMLYAEESEVYDSVDPKKMAKASLTNRSTRPIYKEKQGKYEVAWCIAAVSTEISSKKVFPGKENSKELLWDAIFNSCLINEENPSEAWDKKIENNKSNFKKMNDLHIKTLHYRNSLGTDLIVELNDKGLWCGADEKMPDGTPLMVNMPTEEIFTSPKNTGTNGIVYASKPLIYGGKLIEDFWIKFENGKVIDFDAKVGKEALSTIINMDENSCMLGEAALVEYDSPISNSKILYYNTLFDENAACHLALGDGFDTCYQGGADMTSDELFSNGVNQSKEHTDFMIGTSDLSIIGTTFDGKEVEIFKNGNFAWR